MDCCLLLQLHAHSLPKLKNSRVLVTAILVCQYDCQLCLHNPNHLHNWQFLRAPKAFTLSLASKAFRQLKSKWCLHVKFTFQRLQQIQQPQSCSVAVLQLSYFAVTDKNVRLTSDLLRMQQPTCTHCARGLDHTEQHMSYADFDAPWTIPELKNKMMPLEPIFSSNTPSLSLFALLMHCYTFL